MWQADLLLVTWRVIIFNAGNCASSEDHSVLCQCSSFVTEDVLDLTKLLCYIHGSTLSALIRMRIIKIQAVVNDEDLENFTHFDGDVKRQWNQNLKRF